MTLLSQNIQVSFLALQSLSIQSGVKNTSGKYQKGIKVMRLIVLLAVIYVSWDKTVPPSELSLDVVVD